MNTPAATANFYWEGTKDAHSQPDLRLCTEVSYRAKKVVLPPAIPDWTSNRQALQNLKEQGWIEAAFCATWNSAELITKLNKCTSSGYTVFKDGTHDVPKGFSGRHDKICVILNDCLKDCSSTVFLRTAENTPAFLGGLFYGKCLEEGGEEEARSALVDSATPGAIVVYNKQIFQIPTSFCMGSLHFASKAIEAIIKEDEKGLRCGVCLVALFQNGIFSPSTLVGNCDCAFHVGCIEEKLRSGASNCPFCQKPLPVEWKLQQIPKSVKESRSRENKINASADKVREAMLLDGLEPPEDVIPIPDPGRIRIEPSPACTSTEKLCKGAVVKVKGLRLRCDLNGRLGRIFMPEPRTDGRFGVQMLLDKERVLVQAKNLESLAPPPAPPPAPPFVPPPAPPHVFRTLDEDA